MQKAAAAMRVAAALAVLLVTDGSAAKPARPRLAPPASLCAGGERVVYSCRFGAKVGSVCLGRNSLHYRFGRPGVADITVSSTPDWSNIHTGGNRSQGGLNQDYIRFTNGKTHYVVHVDETGSLNENPGRRSSGIEVLQGETGPSMIASLSCPSRTGFRTDALLALNRSAPETWDGAEVSGGPFEMIY